MGTVHTGRRMRRARRLSAALAACCVSALGVSTATAGATIDLSCAATATINFSPALKGPSTSVSVSGQLSGCTSPNGSQPGVTSGTFTASGATAFGCFPLFSAAGTLLFTWNDTTTSTASAFFSTNPFVPPIISITLTAGRMAGDTVLAVPVLVPDNLGCAPLVPGPGTSRLDVPIAVLPFLP